MPDERVVAQLVADGAQKFVKDFTDAANAVAGLQSKLESADRIRTTQLAGSISEIIRTIDQLAKDGVKDLDDVIAKFNELSVVVGKAGDRVRTPQLRGIAQGLAGAVGEAQAARNRALIEQTQVARFSDVDLAQRVAIARQEAAAIKATTDQADRLRIAQEKQNQAVKDSQLPEKMRAAQIESKALEAAQEGVRRNLEAINKTSIQKTLDPTIRQQQAQLQAVAEAQRRAEAAAAAHAATLQGKLQTALAATTNTLKAVGTTLLNVGNTQEQVAKVTTQATQATNQNAAALINQSSALDATQKQGITYLSTLSAIHAASFLATGRTFSLIGSFFTLGAAFSRLGLGAALIGVTFGGLLAIFNALNTTAQLLQQVLIGIAQTAVVAAATIATAVSAAGVAGVKLAADVEQGLALIQAIEGATREQLGRLVGQAQRIALAYGVSVKDITDASSLFVRAGGNIESAIDGATEAIIKLQVASAGELKAAEAARTIATVLAAFNLTGDQSIRVANNVAAAFQRSALTATEVNQAFQQAIPGSVTFGIKLEDLTAIIVTLGATLRGTVAGTSFKQFLLDLINPADKGAKQLAQLGVSIKDADGNIRPIIPIIGDLSAALDKLAPADRAEAIAEIFESRAGLAGSILSRQSVEKLTALRSELEALTVVDIVDVLLLPLNAQLQRLQVTVTELGRVFGGTLLQPIRQATAGAVNFFQSLIPLAELLGQAVSVVVTNQGFGALQAKISEVTGDTRLSIFLIELVNTFRNVRNVIVDQIVPAIVEFINNLGLVSSESGRLTDTITTFQTINKTVQALGAVTVTAIRGLSLLVTQIIHNEGKGKELRDTLGNLVTLIITQVVVGLATMTAGLIITVKALDLIASALKTNVFPNVATFADIIVKVADLSIGAVQTIVAPWTAVAKAIAFAKSLAEGNDIATALENARNAANAVEGSVAEFALRPTRALRDMAMAVRDVTRFLQGASTDTEGFLKAAQADAQATVKSFQDLSGDLPNFLSNLLDEVQRTIATAREDVDNGGVVPSVVDTKEVERAQERILEAGRDISRRLDALAIDTTTKIQNLVDKALERIGDINEKLQINLDKLTRDTKEKIDDLNEAVTQRRDDRQRLDSERRQQERRLQVIERSLEKQTLFEERQLENVRILRQRATEDVQKTYDLQADAAERSYQRAQEAAEQSFQAQQDAQQRALELTQTAEEKALQRTLDIESRTRDETQQRSEAKTPEDRKRVEEQIARARQDRAFEQKQQGQLDQLKTRHEAQRLALTAKQEQASRAFSNQQEEAALAERLRRDAKALVFRRGLEDQERQIRLTEEDAAFERRRNNETVLDTIKRTQAKAFQDFQDGLEDESNKRREAEFEKDRKRREEDLRGESDRQLREVGEGVNQQLAEINQSIDREIRNALDRLRDIEDSLTPDVAAAVRGALLGVQQAAVTRSQELLSKVSTQTQQAQTTVQQEIVQPFNVGGMVATTLTVQNLVLPGGFTNEIAQGTFSALSEADRRGFFDTDIPALRELINVLSNPSPLNVRR